jgi:uncharacterized protein (TIGR00369 family)
MASLDELRTFFTRDFPQCTATIEAAEGGFARVRQEVGADQLRPGGTVAGPVMMAAADAASYAAILATVGIVPLAVTTSLHIHFLRRPAADRAILAEASILKLGQKLVVTEMRITSEGADDLVAHATATYALPPPEKR